MNKKTVYFKYLILKTSNSVDLEQLVKRLNKLLEIPNIAITWGNISNLLLECEEKLK